MTKYLKILRILIISAFLINITALFLTHFGMAILPCEPEDIVNANNGWCIQELNPIASTQMGLGGFGLHFSLTMIIWALVFLWWEKRILRKAVWNKHAWIPALMMLSVLTIDLSNDIYILIDTLRLASVL